MKRGVWSSGHVSLLGGVGVDPIPRLPNTARLVISDAYTGDAHGLAEPVNQVVVSAAIGDSFGRFPELLDGAEAWICDMTLFLRRRRGWESKATTTKVSRNA
jgi:hypothetical protein